MAYDAAPMVKVGREFLLRRNTARRDEARADGVPKEAAAPRGPDAATGL